MSAASVEGGPQKCTFEEKLLEKNWKNIGEYKLNENFTGPKLYYKCSSGHNNC